MTINEECSTITKTFKQTRKPTATAVISNEANRHLLIVKIMLSLIETVSLLNVMLQNFLHNFCNQLLINLLTNISYSHNIIC